MQRVIGPVTWRVQIHTAFKMKTFNWKHQGAIGRALIPCFNNDYFLFLEDCGRLFFLCWYYFFFSPESEMMASSFFLLFLFFKFWKINLETSSTQEQGAFLPENQKMPEGEIRFLNPKYLILTGMKFTCLNCDL